jgi:uncharacterized protein involved in cysteine biosynthesis
MPLKAHEQSFLELISAAPPLSWREGLFAPLRAIGYIFTHPRVLLLCLAPWLINLFVLTPLVYVIAFWLVFPWLASFVPMEYTWLGQSLGYLWRVFLVLVLIVAGLLLFFIVAMIIGSPFHEAASAAIEREQLRGRPELWARNDTPFLTSIWLSMLGTVKLLIGLIPFVGWLGAWLLNAYLQARFLTLEAFGVPLDRRGITIDGKWNWLRGQHTFAVGFGVPCLLIPFSFFLLPPIATVAASLLMCDMLNRVPPEKTRLRVEVKQTVEG